MIFTEKIKPTGLQTDISPRAQELGGDRKVVNPLIDALNARYMSSEDDDMMTVESIKGTTDLNHSLPGGTNQCIGAFEDEENNRLIFFNHNSNNNHGVYSWNPESNTFTTHLEDSVLNFSSDPQYLITGIGVVNDLLYWTDNLNPQRVINVTKSYSSPDEREISLIKHAPYTPPAFGGGHDGGRNTDLTKNANLITNKNLQFAHRYVYLDNEKSMLSPYTPISPADEIPNLDGTMSRNRVYMIITVDSDILTSIKSVEVCVREGNTGDWGVFHIEENPNSFTQYYYGNENIVLINTKDSAKLFDSVPRNSKAISMFKNRVFTTANKEGFTFDESDVTLTASDTYAVHSANQLYYKMRGSYDVGIVYYDKFGRTNGVYNRTSIDFETKLRDPFGTNKIYVIDKNNLPQLSVALSGDPPIWAYYYEVVVSKDKYYKEYQQFNAGFHFYFSEVEDGVAAPSFAHYKFKGKYFFNFKPTTATSSWDELIYLQIPASVPITPKEGDFVRLLDTVKGTADRIEQIIRVEGDLVLVSAFGISDWTSTENSYLVEIFSLQENQQDTKFYGTGEVYAVSNPGQGSRSFSTSPITPQGDTFYLEFLDTNGKDRFYYDTNEIVGTYSFVGNTAVESPSPVKQNITVDKDSFALQTGTGTVLGGIGTGRMPDYTKSAGNIGRPFVFVENNVESLRGNTIRFSDVFVQDSSINGLSSFDFANEYTLPSERSPIKKLQPTGEILLAVHERNLTSLYINKDFIQTSDGKTQLTTTDKVVGNENLLKGGYGSYHPESVKEINGNVFGFDIFKGIVWRYTSGGVIPISEYGMKDYFRGKAEAYIDDKESIRIVAAIDPYHKEYILTFPAFGGNAAETIAFNYENNVWVTKYSFTPEYYSQINNFLIGFKDGKPHKHNSGATYNNFYGTQYTRKLRIAINPQPSKVKNYLSLNISADQIMNDETGTDIPIRAYNKEGQETYTPVYEFEKLEGTYYAPILKDINTPNVDASLLELRHGDDMRSQVLELEVICDRTDAALLYFVNVNYVTSEYSR